MFLLSAPAALFLVEKSPFSAFAAHLCGMCKISLWESYFPPNHNLIAIKQLQTAQTAPHVIIDRWPAGGYEILF